jgi:glycine oxidase
MYDRFVARVVGDSAGPVEYERSGTLQVALDSQEAAALCAMARTFVDAGIDHALLDPAEARRLEPTLREGVTAVLHVRDQGYVAVGALTQALAGAAAARGAVLLTEPVLSIAGGDSPSVSTPSQTLRADAVIVAAGSWSSTVSTPDADIVRPIRGQIVQLRAGSRPASRIIWGGRCYIVPWRDGTVLAGATVEDVGFDESATASGVQELLAASIALMPALRDAAFEQVRVGLRPMTRDELPAIGPSSRMRGVFYATGHYRNGVLLAPLTASLVADLVVDGREGPELALVRPARLGL